MRGVIPEQCVTYAVSCGSYCSEHMLCRADYEPMLSLQDSSWRSIFALLIWSCSVHHHCSEQCAGSLRTVLVRCDQCCPHGSHIFTSDIQRTLHLVCKYWLHTRSARTLHYVVERIVSILILHALSVHNGYHGAMGAHWLLARFKQGKDG